MAQATTVLEWSEGYAELSKTNGYQGPAVSKLLTLLDQAGVDLSQYDIGDGNIFNYGVEEALKDFQRVSLGMENPSGILDNNTLNALLVSADIMKDLIIAENNEKVQQSQADANEDGDPHYDTFFSEKNNKFGRQNQQDIIITLGDNTIVKTIRNVFVRGVSVEYDTSGNPISEVYEFIGQDLTESDEDNDLNKY